MSEQPPAPEPGSPEFEEARQRYWDAWLSIARQAAARTGESAARPAPAAWSEALGRWWEAAAPAYANADPGMFAQLIPEGQAYLVFGEQALKIIASLHDTAESDEDWRKALQRGFERVRESFFQPFQGRDSTHPGLAAFWGLPMTSWQHIAASLPALSPSPLRDGLEKALGMPALGLAREWQEQSQVAGSLGLDYQEANHEYAELLRRAADRSLDLLQTRLLARAERGEPVDSLRAFYNLWVDCGEEAYAELVRSPEYGETKGRMINALMRLRRHGQLMIDEVLGALRIPQRRELDTAHARLQETRRRLKRLEKRTDDANVDHMEGSITGLRDDIRAMQRELRNLQAGATTKAPGKKRRGPGTNSRKS